MTDINEGLQPLPESWTELAHIQPLDPIEGNTVDPPEMADQRSRLHKVLKSFRYMGASIMVGLEVGPYNEAIRYGALAFTQASVSTNPWVGAAVMGGTTFAVEVAGAYAAAELVNSTTGNKAIEKLNHKLHKIIPPDKKMTPPAEVMVGLVGGSSIIVAEKKRENPEWTIQQTRRHGLFTAQWMAAVLAIDGAILSELDAVHNLSDPKVLGYLALSYVTVSGIGKAGKRFMKKDNDNE